MDYLEGSTAVALESGDQGDTRQLGFVELSPVMWVKTIFLLTQVPTNVLSRLTIAIRTQNVSTYLKGLIVIARADFLATE